MVFALFHISDGLFIPVGLLFVLVCSLYKLIGRVSLGSSIGLDHHDKYTYSSQQYKNNQ